MFRYVDVRRTGNMIGVVWTLPLLFVLIPLTWWFGDLGTKVLATKFYICTMWTLMLVLVVSMSVFYVLATRRAKVTIRTRRNSLGRRAHDKAAALARKELRVVHLFGFLLFFFVAAYLPILYINFCLIIGAGSLVPPTIAVVSLYLLIINSVLNPLLCILLKKDYLKAIKVMFDHRRSSHIPQTVGSRGRYAEVQCSDGSFHNAHPATQLLSHTHDEKIEMEHISFLMEREAVQTDDEMSYPKFLFI